VRRDGTGVFSPRGSRTGTPAALAAGVVALLGLAPDALPASPCWADLNAYRWTHRPLLVFAPSAQDPRYAVFAQRAHRLGAELAERDVPLVHAFVRMSGHAPACTLDPATAERLRSAFGVRPEDATAVLLGKDGGEKQRQPLAEPLDPLLDLIDGMPMRQREIRERGRP
jgi:hypothetical protein